jgi:hypothetical protein
VVFAGQLDLDYEGATITPDKLPYKWFCPDFTSPVSALGPYRTRPSQIRRTCGSPVAHGLLSAHLQRLRKCSKITRAPAIGPIIKAALVHHGSSLQVGRPLVSNMDSSSTTTQQRNAASHLNAGIRNYRNDWKSLVASIKLSARCHVNIAKELRNRTSSC